jgi:prepilin-type processing-associated H-X9-DG protein
MWSGWAMLLPMLEESNLYASINFSRSVWESNNYTNTTAIATSLGLFACPSNSDAVAMPIYANPADPTSTVLYYAGLSNYKGNMAAGLRPGCANPQNLLCQIFDNGIFFRNSSVSFRDINDGASNTIFMGESVDGLWADATKCCVRTSPDREMNQKANGVFTTPFYWTSMHPGGVNFLLGDGSCRQVDDTIDTNVLIRVMTRSGHDPVEDTEF